jgi:hypothetical protein
MNADADSVIPAKAGIQFFNHEWHESHESEQGTLLIRVFRVIRCSQSYFSLVVFAFSSCVLRTHPPQFSSEKRPG